MTIVPIVEGYGDVEAVPLLLRRLAAIAMATVRIGRAWRVPRSRLVDEAELKRVARAASLQNDCAGIIVLLDADDDLACELGPRIAGWLAEEIPQTPSGVVIAEREYEAWFLGSIESIRGQRGIHVDAQIDVQPEVVRNPKKVLELLMPRGRSYHETTDQPAFSNLIDLSMAYRTCSSFRKLVRDTARILTALAASAAPLPPNEWTDAPNN